MLSVDDLKEIYGKKEDKDLVDVFKRSQGAISKWRHGGVPASVELVALEYLRAKEISRSTADTTASPPDTELQTLADKWPTLSRSKRDEIMRALYTPDKQHHGEEDNPQGKSQPEPTQRTGTTG